MIQDKIASSFRDPSGFIYRHDGVLYRQINHCAAADYDALISTGLYDELCKQGLIIDHTEVSSSNLETDGCYKTIKPREIPYVSYPYEWCFSQLKDASLLTLNIQALALEYGMSLKDASAYNVQFINNKPIFIDTLSFQKYTDNKPWVAYRQFCQHFLGPLALMTYRDPRLRHLLKSMIDGIPLDLVTKLLPSRSYFSWGISGHLHLHAFSQKRHQNDARNIQDATKGPNMSRKMQHALITSLKKAIKKCYLRTYETEWANYYKKTNYSDVAMAAKEQIVLSMAKKICAPNKLIHDIGSNTGRFSRLLAKENLDVVSHDIDEMAVEFNYRYNKKNNEKNVLPLLLDINNPSPALGWGLEERDSFVNRAKGQIVIALALIHHIVISNNVPLESVAEFFGRLAECVLIEFVPKSDSQVQVLLATRQDIFPNYTIENFRSAFCVYFEITEERKIPGSTRTIFSFQRRKIN